MQPVRCQILFRFSFSFLTLQLCQFYTCKCRYFFFPPWKISIFISGILIYCFQIHKPEVLPCSDGGDCYWGWVSSARHLAPPAALHCATGPVRELGVTEMHGAIKHLQERRAENTCNKPVKCHSKLRYFY